MKFGIIGFGKMGQIRARTLEQSGMGEIVSVYEPNDKVELPYQRAFTEYEILKNPTIDSIFVCTPNYKIPELCISGLQNGKNVFSEKPPGLNADDVSRVIKVENEFPELRLMYGFNHRHHESIKKMKNIIEGKDLGKILWMRGRYGKEVDNGFFNEWRADPKLAGGGILLDQGIHMLDLFLHFAGDFNETSAFVSNLYWKVKGIEDNVFAIYRNSSSGICASLHSTMTQWRYLFSLEVFMEKGSLILNGLKTTSGVYGDEKLTIKKKSSLNNFYDLESEETYSYENDDSWKSEILHFCNAINYKKEIKYGSSNDAYKLMKLIDKTYGK
jgi:1,5-anhydro-D-fructose reductase (1,5-anhydro-D-mannitol-forming)